MTVLGEGVSLTSGEVGEVGPTSCGQSDVAQLW